MQQLGRGRSTIAPTCCGVVCGAEHDVGADRQGEIGVVEVAAGTAPGTQGEARTRNARAIARRSLLTGNSGGLVQQAGERPGLATVMARGEVRAARCYGAAANDSEDREGGLDAS